MPGVVVRGEQEPVYGLACESWLDDPQLALKAGEDCRVRRTAWVRGITLHTTLGSPDEKTVLPGLGDHTRAARRIGRWWSRDGRRAGCHLLADSDGQWACLADLVSTTTFHAGAVNEVSIGIEIYQSEDGSLYDGQLESVLLMVDWLTRRFGIQRQLHFPYVGTVQRLRNGGDDCVGVYGHRDVTSTRGRGDPGDQVFERLLDAGYEAYDFGKEQDLEIWRTRQRELNSMGANLYVDGVPGPATARALRTLQNKPHGLFVSRPGD